MEPLTAEVVTDLLRRRFDPSADCTGVARGPIGNGQETWFLDVTTTAGHRQLVLRRTAEAGPLEWTDRAQEADHMRAVADRGLPVPRIHWSEPDAADLGAPYLVMDRAPGTPVVRATGAEREDLARDLAARLADLHAAAIPDPQRRDAATATRAEIAKWRDHYRSNRVAPVPLLDGLLAWCEANVPDLADRPAVLVWGDAGSHNTLGSDGRVTALLDWELAHPGDPLEDLGAAIWIDEDAGVDPEIAIAAYQEASGRPVDRSVVDFFVAMTAITRSLMIIVGAGAFVRGRTHAPNLAGLGLDLPGVHLARAARLAGWGRIREPQEPPRPAPPDDVLRPTAAEIDDGIARFLRDEVLEQVTDRRTRRGIKTAVALLETAAIRADSEATVSQVRRAATDALIDELRPRGVSGRLDEIAVRIETEPELADLRPRVRAHLLEDLALQRDLLVPLRRLYDH